MQRRAQENVVCGPEAGTELQHGVCPRRAKQRARVRHAAHGGHAAVRGHGGRKVEVQELEGLAVVVVTDEAIRLHDDVADRVEAEERRAIGWEAVEADQLAVAVVDVGKGAVEGGAVALLNT